MRTDPMPCASSSCATRDDFAWQRLATLTDTFGNRMSASDNMARAVAWATETMKADGLENVRAERVMVPNWIRGAESAEIVEPARHPVVVLGLGGTVATPPGGLEAEVVPVTSFADLKAKGAEVKGRIVLFDVTYSTYAETVTYRTGGARAAAEAGAVAVLVRSVGPIGLAHAAHGRGDATRRAARGFRRSPSPAKTRTASCACRRRAAACGCGW